MLPPPSYFYEKKWLRTVLPSSRLSVATGLSPRTIARLWSGDGFCSPKTHKKIISSWLKVRQVLGFPDRSPEWYFDHKRPWRTLFRDILPEAMDSRTHKLSYAVQVMLRIEDAMFALGHQLSGKNLPEPHEFPETGLPDSILPRDFLFEFSKAIIDIPTGATRIKQPANAGRVMLRTFMFVLAAWEVAILRAGCYIRNKEPFVHKYLPKIIKDKYAPPMKLFFEGIQEHYAIKSNEEFAAYFEIDSRTNCETEAEETARAQLYRWKSGKKIPEFNTIRDLAVKLEYGNEQQQELIWLQYAIYRTIQELYNDCKDSINVSPPFFSCESEIINIFQEYPKWFSHHASLHAQWTKQEATLP